MKPTRPKGWPPSISTGQTGMLPTPGAFSFRTLKIKLNKHLKQNKDPFFITLKSKKKNKTKTLKRIRTHRLPKILEKNLVLNQWGELHGPAFKAANTRAAAYPRPL